MILTLAHIGVAGWLENDLWRLSDHEAEAYTRATSEFIRWHMPVLEPNGKRGSEIALLLTMGMIYIPKSLASMQLRRARRAAVANGAAAPIASHDLDGDGGHGAMPH